MAELKIRTSARTWSWTVLILVALAVFAAFIGSGALGGTPVQDAAGGWLSADGTPLAPGGGAFSIWSVIYLGLCALAVHQMLPRQLATERLARTRLLIAVSALLNALWLGVVQAGLLDLSVLVIIILLVVLARIMALLLRYPAESKAEAVIVDGTMGLYLGWVAVATVANISAWLAAQGFSAFGLRTELAAGLVLGIAATIGVVMAIGTRGRWAPALALSWGLAWIGVGRLDGGLVSQTIAVTAFSAAGVVLLSTLAVVLRRRRQGAAPAILASSSARLP